MLKLKNITDSSWLVLDTKSNKPLGLLSENPNESLFLLMGQEKAKFKNRDELLDFLGFDIFQNTINVSIDDKKQNYINGYPVEYKEIFPIQDHPSGLPIFSKSETSDTLYCAGYYCLRRDHGWAKSYCSKLDTLEKYEYEGPFKTNIECRTRLSDLKKQEKNKKRASN